MHLVIALCIGGDEVDTALCIADLTNRCRRPIFIEQAAEAFQEF